MATLAGVDAWARSGRSRALPASSVCLIAGLGSAYAWQGAFYRPAQLVVAGLVVLAVLFSWLSGGSGPSAVVALLGWAGCGVCVWAVLSALVNGSPTGALGTVGSMLALGAVGSVARSLDRVQRDVLVAGLLALGCFVVVTGWWGLVTGHGGWVADGAVRRAATSITYPNAAAALLVSLALISGVRAAASSSVVDHVVTCLLLSGALATLSRGGVVALGAGLVVLGVAGGPRSLVHGLGPGLVGAGMAIAGLAPAFTQVSPSVWRPLVGFGAGVLTTAVLAGRRVGVILLAVAAGACLAAATVITGGAAFVTETGRVGFTAPERRASTVAGVELGARHPLVGVGPGQALVTWRAPDGRTLSSRFVHNEYVQTFVELGAVGAALVLVFIIGIARRIWHARTTLPRPPLWAGALAALAAFCTHSLVDFVWRIPALPFTLAALVGLALPYQPTPVTGEEEPPNPIRPDATNDRTSNER